MWLRHLSPPLPIGKIGESEARAVVVSSLHHFGRTEKKRGEENISRGDAGARRRAK